VNTLQTLAVLKCSVFLVLVAVPIPTRWRWLTGAMFVLVVANAAIVVGVSRLTSSIIGLAFLPFLLAHVFDVTRYSKPR